MAVEHEAVINTPVFFELVFPAVWDRFVEIAMAVFIHPQMVWILVPLLATLLMMELYFSRYTREELGWNTAVGNSLVLIFVSLDLLRQLYGNYFYFGAISNRFAEVPVNTLIAIFIGLEGITILAFNFFHALPKKVAFSLTASLPINFTAYIAIVIIYTNVPIDGWTFVASVIFFIILKAVFSIIYFLVPTYEPRYVGNTLYKLMHFLVKSEDKMKHQKKKKKKGEKSVVPFFAPKKP